MKHFIGLTDSTVTNLNLFSFVDSKNYPFFGSTVAVLVYSQLAPVVHNLETAILRNSFYPLNSNIQALNSWGLLYFLNPLVRGH